MSYRITSQREFISAMGIVCSLVLNAFAVTSLFVGMFEVHLRDIGAWTFRKEEEPIGFWLLVGTIVVVGSIGMSMSVRAFARARRAAKTPVPNTTVQSTAASPRPLS